MTYKLYHADERYLSPELVSQLIAVQFPQWTQLPVHYLQSAGTDNVIYRLGDALLVRLPRIASAEKSLQKEVKWLPKIASQLELSVPIVHEAGQPTEDYPLMWAIYEWLDGETVSLDDLPDTHQLAHDIADFLLQMRTVHVDDSESLIATGTKRGAPLIHRDAITRENIEGLTGKIDTNIAHQVWQSALDAPIWEGDPVWIHGDLQAGNLLTQNGRLSAVIDWGLIARGDPTYDLMVAWSVLPADARQTLREALALDEAMWSRGRGWALSWGVVALPYYEQSNPTLAGIARRAIEAAIADFRINS